MTTTTTKPYSIRWGCLHESPDVIQHCQKLKFWLITLFFLKFLEMKVQ